MAEMHTVATLFCAQPLPQPLCQELSFHDDTCLAPIELKGKQSQKTAISSFNLFDDGMLGKNLYK